MDDKQAFKVEHEGFAAEAFWIDGSSDARVVVTRNGKPYKEFLYPSYKIWNIYAHWQDIVEGELRGSDTGYQEAGSDLLGGCVMPRGGAGRKVG